MESDTKRFSLPLDLRAEGHAIDLLMDTSSYGWPLRFGVVTQPPTLKLTWNPAGDMMQDALALAKGAEVAVVFVSDAQTEGVDHGASLPGDQDVLVSRVAALAKKTVVVLNTGSALVLPWADRVDAVLENWYGGEEMGTAIAALLFGDANPSGKLVVTFPASEAQLYARSASEYPGTKAAGDGYPTVDYDEGIFVGYRHFDQTRQDPLFPFGHGLSYTNFAYSELRVTPDGGARGEVTVKARVTNTGRREGKEVAQLYVGFPPWAGEPPRQLKGFFKVSLLPGRSAGALLPSRRARLLLLERVHQGVDHREGHLPESSWGVPRGTSGSPAATPFTKASRPTHHRVKRWTGSPSRGPLPLRVAKSRCRSTAYNPVISMGDCAAAGGWRGSRRAGERSRSRGPARSWRAGRPGSRRWSTRSRACSPAPSKGIRRNHLDGLVPGGVGVSIRDSQFHERRTICPEAPTAAADLHRSPRPSPA